MRVRARAATWVRKSRFSFQSKTRWTSSASVTRSRSQVRLSHVSFSRSKTGPPREMRLRSKTAAISSRLKTSWSPGMLQAICPR